MTSNVHFIIKVKGPYLSFEILYEDKIYKYVHQTLMDTMLRLSDFVTC